MHHTLHNQAAKVAILLVLASACAAVTVQEYRDLLAGTTFQGGCRSPAAAQSADEGSAKVCLGPDHIAFNMTVSSDESRGNYTFAGSQSEINGTQYFWEEIVATNINTNVSQLSTTDNGNVIVARIDDDAGFCWWVRINIKEKTLLHVGSSNLASIDAAPDACPARPADAHPPLDCDGSAGEFTFICNGVLTAGDWPTGSPAASHRSFLSPVLALLAF